jgi:serine/threonine-protein kinase HipA
MTIKSQNSSESIKPVYVWIWLDSHAPVVAGVITSRVGRDGAVTHGFRYGESYKARKNAIDIYSPELPLRGAGLILSAHRAARGAPALAGCLRDAMPDAWGRRVIVNRLTSARRDDINVDMFDETTYMLNSGSDRIGALDFQESPTDYVPRNPGGASIDILIEASRTVEMGKKLPSHLDGAIFHGNSIGGARPKAMVDYEKRKYLLKFPSTTDVFPVIKGEYVAMRLAALSGIDVAPVRILKIGSTDVLAIERFDRVKAGAQWLRRPMVSALTMLGLDEMTSRYASYRDLADIIRRMSKSHHADSLRDLFARISFNILVGNTDDHARNHAAFWDGKHLTMTPAYDICPQMRTGHIASQAMLISDGDRSSRLITCLYAAPSFGLRRAEAIDLIKGQIDLINSEYINVCDEAGLGEIDRESLWGNQFMNPFCFEEWPEQRPMVAISRNATIGGAPAA